MCNDIRMATESSRRERHEVKKHVSDEQNHVSSVVVSPDFTSIMRVAHWQLYGKVAGAENVGSNSLESNHMNRQTIMISKHGKITFMD